MAARYELIPLGVPPVRAKRTLPGGKTIGEMVAGRTVALTAAAVWPRR
jgi:hypothetical protein